MDFCIKNNRESQNNFFNQKVLLINFGKNLLKYMENLENYGGSLLRAAAGAFFSPKNHFLSIF